MSYLNTLSPLISSLRFTMTADDAHAIKGGQQHLYIIRAVLLRDKTRAEHLLAAHIDAAKEFALELYFSPPPRTTLTDRPWESTFTQVVDPFLRQVPPRVPDSI